MRKYEILVRTSDVLAGGVVYESETWVKAPKKLVKKVNKARAQDKAFLENMPK